MWHRILWRPSVPSQCCLVERIACHKEWTALHRRTGDHQKDTWLCRPSYIAEDNQPPWGLQWTELSLENCNKGPEIRKNWAQSCVLTTCVQWLIFIEANNPNQNDILSVIWWILRSIHPDEIIPKSWEKTVIYHKIIQSTVDKWWLGISDLPAIPSWDWVNCQVKFASTLRFW